MMLTKINKEGKQMSIQKTNNEGRIRHGKPWWTMVARRYGTFYFVAANAAMVFDIFLSANVRHYYCI